MYLDRIGQSGTGSVGSGRDRMGSYIPSHARRHSVVELHSHVRSHRRIPAELGTEGLRPVILGVKRVLTSILGLRQGRMCRILSRRGWSRGATVWEGMVQEGRGRNGMGWDGTGWDGTGWDGMWWIG